MSKGRSKASKVKIFNIDKGDLQIEIALILVHL